MQYLSAKTHRRAFGTAKLACKWPLGARWLAAALLGPAERAFQARRARFWSLQRAIGRELIVVGLWEGEFGGEVRRARIWPRAQEDVGDRTRQCPELRGVPASSRIQGGGLGVDPIDKDRGFCEVAVVGDQDPFLERRAILRVALDQISKRHFGATKLKIASLGGL